MTISDSRTPSQQAFNNLFQHIILAMCVVYLLIVGTDIVAIVLYKKGWTNPIAAVVLIPILATTMLYFRHLFRGAFASPEILGMVFLAVLSVAWSDFPMHSLERCVPLVVTTAFAFALGSMLSLRGFLLFLTIFFATAMVLAMLAIIALPQARGNPPWENTWTGIYVHKNALGLASMMALLSSYYAWQQFHGKLKFVFVITMTLAVLLLVASDARTSQVIALFSMSALVISKLMPRKETVWAIGFILVSVGVVGFSAFILVSPFGEPLFAIIGRKPTLSERIPIWETVWPYVMDQLWFGYGYKAYWHEEATHLSAYSSKANLGFLPHYSHNGLLETFLNIGLFGVVLLACVFLRFFFSMIYCLRFLKDRDAFVFLIVLGMTFIFSNITESMVLSRLNANWIFFVAYTTKVNLVAKALQESAKARNLAAF